MNATVEGVLGEGGLLAARLGDAFESRGEQVEVARAVLRAMEEKSVLLCEAGTGVGKSFAYLVPAMLRCLAGETVVVATNTIALQEQLVRKDIPLLRDILDPDGSAFDGGEEFENAKIRPVLVKGRGNYVSLRRLKLASQRQDKLFADSAARRSLHVIEDWAATTLDGTLSTLPALERPGVWDKVESDTGNCMGRKCPNHQACFYQRARRTMEKGNLLICNHALFFSDLALRAQDAGFMPEYQHVVLDEAHNAEDVASEHFGVSLTEGRVMHLLTTLYAERSGKGYLPNLTLASGDAGAVDAAMREVLFAADASRRFFESALELLPRKASVFGGGSGGGEPGSVRYRSPGMLDGELAARMTRLSLTLKALRDVIKVEADQFELNAYAQRAQMIADSAVTLTEQKLPGCAYWVEAGGEQDGGRLRKVTVACAPVEVGPLLKEHLFGRDFGVTLTSATLATRTRREGEMDEHAETAFSHVMARLGCDALAERKVRTMQVGSPFDYARQVELVVDERVDSKTAFSRRVSRREDEWIDLDAPGPAAETPPKREMSYSEKLAACLEEHLRESEGGAFVLFTSFATLNAVAMILRPRLEADGMPVLGQGIDGSREEILARFREDHRSVLLGAASFWQGVDVRGRGLRNVIITKLPFEPPDRPLTEARCELIQQRGGNPFMEDSIPRAVIRFKQGFGRLIRSKEDQGRVVVMDGRVFSARYGRLFLEALPRGVPVTRVR
jgi:ATP-dependent DNA helicase DinG